MDIPTAVGRAVIESGGNDVEGGAGIDAFAGPGSKKVNSLPIRNTFLNVGSDATITRVFFNEDEWQQQQPTFSVFRGAAKGEGEGKPCRKSDFPQNGGILHRDLSSKALDIREFPTPPKKKPYKVPRYQ